MKAFFHRYIPQNCRAAAKAGMITVMMIAIAAVVFLAGSVPVLAGEELDWQAVTSNDMIDPDLTNVAKVDEARVREWLEGRTEYQGEDIKKCRFFYNYDDKSCYNLCVVNDMIVVNVTSHSVLTDIMYVQEIAGFKLFFIPSKLEYHTAVPPSCTVSGTDGYYTSPDGIIYADAAGTKEIGMDDLVLPPLGHEWDEGYFSIEPTYKSDGEKTYTCVRDGCGATYTESVPRLDEDKNYSLSVTENTWSGEKGGVLRFTINNSADSGKPGSTYRGVSIDGAAQEHARLVSEDGRLNIIIESERLESMSEGRHTLTAVFTDGEASAEFFVIASMNEYSGGVIRRIIGIAVAALFLAALIALCIFLMSNRRPKEKKNAPADEKPVTQTVTAEISAENNAEQPIAGQPAADDAEKSGEKDRQKADADEENSCEDVEGREGEKTREKDETDTSDGKNTDKDDVGTDSADNLIDSGETAAEPRIDTRDERYIIAGRAEAVRQILSGVHPGRDRIAGVPDAVPNEQARQESAVTETEEYPKVSDIPEDIDEPAAGQAAAALGDIAEKPEQLPVPLDVEANKPVGYTAPAAQTVKAGQQSRVGEGQPQNVKKTDLAKLFVYTLKVVRRHLGTAGERLVEGSKTLSEAAAKGGKAASAAIAKGWKAASLGIGKAGKTIGKSISDAGRSASEGIRSLKCAASENKENRLKKAAAGEQADKASVTSVPAARAPIASVTDVPEKKLSTVPPAKKQPENNIKPEIKPEDTEDNEETQQDEPQGEITLDERISNILDKSDMFQSGDIDAFINDSFDIGTLVELENLDDDEFFSLFNDE